MFRDALDQMDAAWDDDARRKLLVLHTYARNHSPVISRPSCVWDVPDEDGSMGICAWGQRKADYGLIAAPFPRPAYRPPVFATPLGMPDNCRRSCSQR